MFSYKDKAGWSESPKSPSALAMPTPTPSGVSCTRTTLPFARNRRPGPSGSREGRSTVKSSWLARGGAAEGMHTNNPLMLMSRLNPAPPQGICRSSLHAKDDRNAQCKSARSPPLHLCSVWPNVKFGHNSQHRRENTKGQETESHALERDEIGQDCGRGMPRAA